ncbi:MAG TPA: glycosyltransferase family 39 protein, partial [Anaeromyxobacteraceae bacterium]|nr:glycosyltransferase family 39 protein [Anaeromyxobacteraceae bacterium]
MDELRSPQELPSGWPGRKAAWLLLAAACAGVALVRWHLREVPLERDEGEYAYFGQLLLRGLPPFRLAYSMKLPGTQGAYALAMAAFGQTAAGIRIGLLLVNAATTALLFLLGRRLLGTLGGLAAALAFAFLSTSSAMLALFGHATHFVALPAVAGLLLLLRAAETGRLAGFLASGLCLGAAVLMKQPGGVFLLFAAAWHAWSRLRGGGAKGRLLAEEGTLLAGAAAPLALVVAWAWAGGTLGELWFWVVRYAREYSTSLTLHEGAGYLARNASAAFAEARLLWILAGAGLAVAAWPRWRLPGRAFLIGLPAFSFAGVSAGLYYRPHYFILLLPAAALLAGVSVGFAARRAPAGWNRAAALVGLGLLAAGGAQSAWAQRSLLFEMTPAQVSRAIYGANPFPESPEIGRYLAVRTSADDRIAVLGSEPQILFYARRLSATGHVYAYGLMEPQPFARAMQEQMAREVEAGRPAYLVWVLVPTSWLMQPG